MDILALAHQDTLDIQENLDIVAQVFPATRVTLATRASQVTQAIQVTQEDLAILALFLVARVILVNLVIRALRVFLECRVKFLVVQDTLDIRDTAVQAVILVLECLDGVEMLDHLVLQELRDILDPELRDTRAAPATLDLQDLLVLQAIRV